MYCTLSKKHNVCQNKKQGKPRFQNNQQKIKTPTISPLCRQYSMRKNIIQKKLEGAEDETLAEGSILYHGSSANISDFATGIDISKTRNKQLGDGFYTTISKETAQGYGQNLYKITTLREMHGQKLAPCKEMKNITDKSVSEMAFFTQADTENDFLHTNYGNFEGKRIYEQHKLTSNAIGAEDIKIEKDNTTQEPVAEETQESDDITLESIAFIPMGNPKKRLPPNLRKRLMAAKPTPNDTPD